METFRSLFLIQTKMQTLKQSYFFWKPLETKSLAEVQFVIESFYPISQSNYLSDQC